MKIIQEPTRARIFQGICNWCGAKIEAFHYELVKGTHYHHGPCPICTHTIDFLPNTKEFEGKLDQ